MKMDYIKIIFLKQLSEKIFLLRIRPESRQNQAESDIRHTAFVVVTIFANFGLISAKLGIVLASDGLGELAVRLVLVVLGNAEIAPCDGERGVVVYFHDDSGAYA
jgi:hypothetical protein